MFALVKLNICGKRTWITLKENQTPEAVISIDDDANINPTSIKSKTQSELSISSKTSLDEKPKNSPARKPRRTKAEMEKEKKEKEEQRKRKAEELAKKKAEKVGSSSWS